MCEREAQYEVRVRISYSIKSTEKLYSTYFSLKNKQIFANYFVHFVECFINSTDKFYSTYFYFVECLLYLRNVDVKVSIHLHSVVAPSLAQTWWLLLAEISQQSSEMQNYIFFSQVASCSDMILMFRVFRNENWQLNIYFYLSTLPKIYLYSVVECYQCALQKSNESKKTFYCCIKV